MGCAVTREHPIRAVPGRGIAGPRLRAHQLAHRQEDRVTLFDLGADDFGAGCDEPSTVTLPVGVSSGAFTLDLPGTSESSWQRDVSEDAASPTAQKPPKSVLLSKKLPVTPRRRERELQIMKCCLGWSLK
eukprot:TRINITY_DN4766_c2_g3_i1.p1 TRINITY_DN4766_c2_g3~~TRINITY_DN4766_c2_g3_i1.p1  ORF type:complete len:149 (+),score=40.57 TRINITY_DN4766_c2_g3_i1:59-448(+)